MSTLYDPPKHSRSKHDHYPTPPELADALIRGLVDAGIEVPGAALDPCGGAGTLAEGLAFYGMLVSLTDKFPEEYPEATGYVTREPLDATDPTDLRRALALAPVARAVITNTPYRPIKTAERIAGNLVQLVETGVLELVAMLFPLPWVAAGGRVSLFRSASYGGMIVPSWRPEMIPGTGGGGKISFAWHFWHQGAEARRMQHVLRHEAFSARVDLAAIAL